MGLWSKRIRETYAARGEVIPLPKRSTTVRIGSPWAPQDALTTFALDAFDEDTRAKLQSGAGLTIEHAMRVPGIARAHGLHVTAFAEVPFFQMDNDTRTEDQPEWLTNSRSGVPPYHRMFGLGTDLFFHGWGVLGFNAEMTDCIHIPFDMWTIEDGVVVVDDNFPEENAEYTAKLIPIWLGYGVNGVLNDGADTIREARAIEVAYQNRLTDPVPLTVLGIPLEQWQQMTPAERREYRDQWVEGRRTSATALKVAEWPVEMPGQQGEDLYESGRNAVRLDIANHTHTPAALLEGVHQGGSGSTDINYTGVANGGSRSELWDFGLAKRMLLAFEARMSLDDVCPPGLSIRGDRTAAIEVPPPAMNPTSED